MTVKETGLITKIKLYFSGWQGLANGFDALGHLANALGIGVHMVTSFLPIILATLLGPVASVADPLIYCFRGTERLVRLYARNRLGVEFEEEKNAKHPRQNDADILVTILFGLAIIVFALPTTPFLSSLAWFLGLSGVSISGYFDHRFPELAAKEAYLKTNSLEKREAIFKDYCKKYYSTRLYYGLIFSLVLLLILGQATGCGLPLIVDAILNATAQVGSVLVLLINVARAANHFCPQLLQKIIPPPTMETLCEHTFPPPMGSSHELPKAPKFHPSPISAFRRTSAPESTNIPIPGQLKQGM